MASEDILIRSKLKLGKQLLDNKRFDEARVIYEQICNKKRNDADHWFTLGVIYGMLKRHEDAARCCSKAVALAPHHVAAWYNLGIALRDCGQTEEAASALRKTLTLNPLHEAASTSLGHILASLHCYDEAEEVFRNVMSYQAGNAEFYAVYGSAMQTIGRNEAALNAYRKAIELHHPQLAQVRENMAAALCLQGKFDESIAISEAALKAQPENARIYSGLLLTLQYSGKKADLLFERHKHWPGNMLCPASHSKPVLKARPARLRIGYISSDFRKHSVAYFVEPLLAHHDASRFEITCYFNHKDADAVTSRFQKMAHRWRNVHDLDDAQLTQLVTDDGIDILVDLNGHTAGSRLSVFARRAAPVQATFIGYPDTTGVKEMDYRIVDRITDPIGTDQYCTESLVRLPGCFLCYRPQDNSPLVSSSPCEKNGFITFGSFNNLAKVNQDVVNIWSRLLQAIPGSRLVMKNPSLTDQATCERYQALFEKSGISIDRIDLLGFIADDTGHLGAYSRIDIALDTFPYNGTTTTCEALWMGIPVITLAGNRHIARVGASLLTSIGHTEWIATTPEQYIQIAQDIAMNPTLLIQQRKVLREQLSMSALCQQGDYVKSVEDIYDSMLATSCIEAS